MITIFNRKELIVTASMEKQAEVRDILAKNHMPYEVKTVNRSSGSALGGRTRAVTGTCGEKPELMYEYVVYEIGRASCREKKKIMKRLLL